MNTPFLLTITSGTELLSEHVHLNHQIFMKQLSPQQQFLLLRLFSPDSDTLCPEGSSHVKRPFQRSGCSVLAAS